MTLGELKELLRTETTGEKPGSSVIRQETDRIIVSTSPQQEPEIVVHESGWFLYRRDGHETIANVRRCGEYRYAQSDGQVFLPEAYFDALDWRIRLTLEGDERIQENQERSMRRMFAPWDDFQYESAQFTGGRMPLEVLLTHEKGAMLEQAYRELLPRQRELLRKIYLCRKGIREIASEEGVSYQAVQNRLQKSLKKMRNALKKGL